MNEVRDAVDRLLSKRSKAVGDWFNEIVKEHAIPDEDVTRRCEIVQVKDLVGLGESFTCKVDGRPVSRLQFVDRFETVGR